MRAVISSSRSSGNGGSNSGFMAMIMSFMGVPSAAPRPAPRPPPPQPVRVRVHVPAAVGCPVAGLEVDVEAGEAVGAMVAVVTPCVLRGAEPPADLAGKAVIAGMGLIIAFFERFAFIFPIHGRSS